MSFNLLIKEARWSEGRPFLYARIAILEYTHKVFGEMWKQNCPEKKLSTPINTTYSVFTV